MVGVVAGGPQAQFQPPAEIRLRNLRSNPVEVTTMYFQLDAEQQAIQATVARFARERIAPHAAAWDATEHFPREIFGPLADLGLAGMTIPEKYGGTDLSRLTLAIVYETLAMADLSVVVWLAVHNMIASIIARWGDDALRQRYLPALAEGKLLGAFSLSEAGAGSDPTGLRMTARREGDSYILNGTKLWVTSGNVADVFVVFARTSDAPGGAGISGFVVEKGTPGFAAGKIEQKMGLHASPTTELIFTDCRIPATQRLGAEGQGLHIGLSALDGGRINVAAGATGVAQAACDIARDYARERQQFGHPIAEFQAIQFMLADMATQIDAARLLVYRAAVQMDERGHATKEAAMAKCFATDAAMRVTTDAIQVLGGYGYTRDWPLERFMRDVKVTQIFEGTNQIQRVVIARALLKE
jgi:alkylation response protein AidB-like acyl-CoA dehydrogenase